MLLSEYEGSFSRIRRKSSADSSDKLLIHLLRYFYSESSILIDDDLLIKMLLYYRAEIFFQNIFLEAILSEHKPILSNITK